MGRLPGRLPVSPSLNRTSIGRFDGLPEGVAGVPANTWLTPWAIARRMRESPAIVRAAERSHGPLPELPSPMEVAADRVASVAPWPRRLDTLVASGHPEALAMATDLGTALGALVATLVTGPDDARRARPDWPPELWSAWGRVRHLALGGGLLSGPLGRRMVDEAVLFVARQGVPVAMTLVDVPATLVLRGLASLLPEGGGVALDCGGTTVKAATVEGSRLVLRPSRAAPSSDVAADVVALLAEAVADALPTPGPDAVSVGVATYVDRDGQPYAGQLGPYAPLGEVDVAPALRAEVGRRTGRVVTLRVTHDGRAALLGARLDQPQTDAAVVLGTAIGHAVDPR